MGNKLVVVGTLPYVLAHADEIDPDITALFAMPDDDEANLLDLSITIAPVESSCEEGEGGDFAATIGHERSSFSICLTHKPADSTCEARMVGKMKNLRK